MSHGDGPYPRLQIHAREVVGLVDLDGVGTHDAWVYFAEVHLRIRAASTGRHMTVPFRLDPMASVSMIPAAWLLDDNKLLGPLSPLVKYNTSGGLKKGQGRMTRELRFEFPGFPRDYPIELLVSTTLHTKYGLLALRDLHNHFWLKTSGPLTRPSPIGIVGVIDLIPCQ